MKKLFIIKVRDVATNFVKGTKVVVAKERREAEKEAFFLKKEMAMELDCNITKIYTEIYTVDFSDKIYYHQDLEQFMQEYGFFPIDDEDIKKTLSTIYICEKSKQQVKLNFVITEQGLEDDDFYLKIRKVEEFCN